jgi:hypothetical protein
MQRIKLRCTQTEVSGEGGRLSVRVTFEGARDDDSPESYDVVLVVPGSARAVAFQPGQSWILEQVPEDKAHSVDRSEEGAG